MTGTAYPGDAVAGVPTYTANQGRTALAAAMGGATAARPLGGFSGVRVGTPTNIATATSTTWTVTPFGGYIDLETSATNGGYYFSFLANETGTMTAAAGSARVDLLYVQINDSKTGDGSGVSSQTGIGYQAGVAGAGVPALTAARAFVIAQINVPASGGGSPTVTWVAPYTVAAGGILLANTSTQLNTITPAQYQRAVTLDAGAEYQYVGSGWVLMRAHGEWTCAVTAANATLTTLSAGSSAVSGMSSPNVTNLISTTSSGFTATQSGTYSVTLQAKLPTVATGRTFISITNGTVPTEYRTATTTEDVLAVTAEFYVAAGQSVTFQFFQTTGASQTITGRFNITYLGAL